MNKIGSQKQMVWKKVIIHLFFASSESSQVNMVKPWGFVGQNQHLNRRKAEFLVNWRTSQNFMMFFLRSDDNFSIFYLFMTIFLLKLLSFKLLEKKTHFEEMKAIYLWKNSVSFVCFPQLFVTFWTQTCALSSMNRCNSNVPAVWIDQ